MSDTTTCQQSFDGFAELTFMSRSQITSYEATMESVATDLLFSPQVECNYDATNHSTNIMKNLGCRVTNQSDVSISNISPTDPSIIWSK